MTDVKRLLEQATPLPWEARPSSGYQGWKRWQPYPWTLGADRNLIAKGFANSPDADAELIVHAVNRLPDYEAAVDALEKFADHYPGPLSDKAREVLRRLREGVPT